MNLSALSRLQNCTRWSQMQFGVVLSTIKGWSSLARTSFEGTVFEGCGNYSISSASWCYQFFWYLSYSLNTVYIRLAYGYMATTSTVPIWLCVYICLYEKACKYILTVACLDNSWMQQQNNTYWSLFYSSSHHFVGQTASNAHSSTSLLLL